jgi:hypothetical protein
MKSTIHSALLVVLLFVFTSNTYGEEKNKLFTVTPQKAGYVFTLPAKLLKEFPKQFKCRIILWADKEGRHTSALQGFGAKQANDKVLFETKGKFSVDLAGKYLWLGIEATEYTGPKKSATADFDFDLQPVVYTRKSCSGCEHAQNLLQYYSPWNNGHGICYCVSRMQ